jgi:hypothetical protein
LKERFLLFGTNAEVKAAIKNIVASERMAF